MYKRNSKLYILAIVFWLSIWQLVSSLMGQEILLVSPVSALARLGQLSLEVDFWKTVWYSFYKISLGFLLAFVLGIGMALLGSGSRTFRVLIQPLMATIQAIPVVSFIIGVITKPVSLDILFDGSAHYIYQRFDGYR